MAQASWIEHRRLIQNVVVISVSLARNFYIKPSQWRSNQRQTEHLLSLAVVLAAEGFARAGSPPSSEGVFGFFMGVTISGLAEILGGHAINRPIGKRASLIRWFAGIFAINALVQFVALGYLFAAN